MAEVHSALFGWTIHEWAAALALTDKEVTTAREALELQEEIFAKYRTLPAGGTIVDADGTPLATRTDYDKANRAIQLARAEIYAGTPEAFRGSLGLDYMVLDPTKLACQSADRAMRHGHWATVILFVTFAATATAVLFCGVG